MTKVTHYDTDATTCGCSVPNSVRKRLVGRPNSADVRGIPCTAVTIERRPYHHDVVTCLNCGEPWEQHPIQQTADGRLVWNNVRLKKGA